ncbi:hypothetical protein BG011_005835 [Mortierella polycephala]|uniref:Uncharacterized protein n=1 Tax=Mortierella polycephala TaxID=41804 RepID=A0A9P6U0T9_9FUNG|nr:hypothetical protein BG011_005835 [Mortierella polycephala]
MDFFAQTYKQPNNEPRYSGHSTRYPPPRSTSREGAAQGYGCEANAHLRRASFGLESDIGPRHPLMLSHHHHQNPDHYGAGASFTKNPKKKNDNSIIPDTELATTTESVTVAPEDMDLSLSKTTPTITPRITRRASVSNPCLLHHTNSDGSGAVRAPVMPSTVSMSSPQRLDDVPQTESYGPLDDSRARPRRSFSLTIESTK